jgi:Sensors of blue-light using FAD
MNEFKTVFATAQKNSTQRDITGMLVFNSNVFLQCLEGDRDALNEPYVKLVRDPRHSRLAILSFEQVRTRHFADWSMAFTPLNASNRALF